jgi:hypothetical protein
MESPQPQQISVSGHIAIEGQQPAPNSTSLENAPASPSQPWWRFWRKPPEIVLAIATVILAIATIVLAIIAGIQAWILSTTDISTRRAADAAIKSASAAEIAVNNARENFRSEQRPIIWLADTTKFPSFPSFRSELGGRITWGWYFTNYGKTPAVRMSYSHFMSIQGRVEPSAGGATPAAPLPTNKVEYNTIVSRQQMTPEEYDRLSHIDGAIEISAHITYEDAYGGKYETDFCLSKLALGPITYCNEGNEIR